MSKQQHTINDGKPHKRYSTFAGVFTPTLLTILGVIMYLRLGWVVGNAGLFGALLIVLLGSFITLATALSLSSIATNTHIGAGGPYAIIAKSLGLEIGGSVGIPLFLSQTLAVAMYVFGFREGWLCIFPHHLPLAVDLMIFVCLFIITYISTGLAFRAQYVVLLLIAASLVAVFASGFGREAAQPVIWWGTFKGVKDSAFSGSSFWYVFAVFFPACTGIMAGANMSGELKNSRRAIPLGTLSAICVSTLIYLALCVWLATVASPDELISNYNIMLDRSLSRYVVLAGMLGATFSSAISILIGSPRILTAMIEDGLFHKYKWLAKRSATGEPRKALFISCAIVLLALMLRDLNIIAPLITMFFLISYATINAVMLLQQKVGMISFRPTFRIPLLIPLCGWAGCVVTMFIIQPIFSLIAITIVAVLIPIRFTKDAQRRPADVRSGLYVSLAHQAVAQIIKLELTTERSWAPYLLVATKYAPHFETQIPFLSDLCKSEGAVKLLGLAADIHQVPEITRETEQLTELMRAENVFSTSAVLIEADETMIIPSMLALKSAFFKPNIVFVWCSKDGSRDAIQKNLINEAESLQVGVMLFLPYDDSEAIDRSGAINIWLPDLDRLLQSTGGQSRDGILQLPDLLKLDNMNLAILTAYRLSRAWQSPLNLISVIDSDDERQNAEQVHAEIISQCRLPAKFACSTILTGACRECPAAAPKAGLQLFSIGSTLVDFDHFREIGEQTGTPCLFMKDSGLEDALV